MANKTKIADDLVVPAELPELLSLQQAAKILKVHANTLRNWERAGLIPVVRVGPRRDRRFPRHGLNQFLPGHSARTSADGAAADSPTMTHEDVKEVVEAIEEKAKPPLKPETAHVIVNVPLKQSFLRIISITVIALAAILLILAELGKQEAGPSSFAIRRNPPQVLFGEDFEAYEVGALPRPTWNTFGVWNVIREGGQRFLRGEESVDNPIGLLSHVYTGAPAWSNYKLKFAAKVLSGKHEVTALVDYIDERNYYAVEFSTLQVAVVLVKEGKVTTLGTAPLELTNPNTWHTFAVDLYGNDIDVLFEGDRVLGISNADLTSGKIGFAAHDQVIDIDHVQVVESIGDGRPIEQ